MGVEIIVPVAGIIGTFGSLIIFLYLFFTSRHKERMALLEAGKDARIFTSGASGRRSSVKYGLVAILTGFGLFAAHYLEQGGLPGVVAYFSMILIFGGVGLVAYYVFFEKPDEKVKQPEREEEFI